MVLRGIARRLQARTTERTRELSRLRHAEATQATPQVVINDIEANVRHLERRLKEMLRQARKLVRSCAKVRKPFDHLLSVGGVGEKSAVMLLAELLVPPSDMSVRQWVAHTRLDPRKHQSSSSRPEVRAYLKSRQRASAKSPLHACTRSHPVRAKRQGLLRQSAEAKQETDGRER